MRKESRLMTRFEQSIPLLQFGAFLKIQRNQWSIKQRDVLAHLAGWTQTTYSRLESGELAPAFEQLLPLYAALQRAGVQWRVSDRQQFLTLARKRIEQKKTHWEHRPDSDWAELLPAEEQVPPATPWMPPRPLLAEIRHLVGREDWLASIVQAIQERPARKLLVFQGPMGVGKSSELHRLIHHFIRAKAPSYHVLWVPLLPIERTSGPEAALDLVLGTVLSESGYPPPAPSAASWTQRIAPVLAQLEQSTRPILLLIDNAESILTEEGTLASCWETFLAQFLRCQHQATIVLATREWPGWSGRERSFVSETTIPPLTIQSSVLLLQQLGLERVPVPYLREVSGRVGGIPLCLEWVATLVQDPLLLDDWQGFDLDEDADMQGNHTQNDDEMTQRLQRLLAEPALLRGHIATKLKPLLERIIEKRLSAEARHLLDLLAVTTIPLGKAALKVLIERPGPLKELRDASLLVAYPHRVQLLPMVASAVLQQLPPEQVKALEEQLIQALNCWLEEGTISDREAGNLITEQVVLLLKHHRLLEAAQLLLPYSSFSFNPGHAPRLARLTEEIMQCFDWQITEENACGGLLLHYLFSPFLSKIIDAEKQVADYQRILDAVLAEKVILQPSTEAYIRAYIMSSAMDALRFEEAQAVLEASCARLESLQPSDLGLQAYLLELRAWLLGTWSDYAEEQEEKQMAQMLREQTIALYRQCITLHSPNGELSPLRNSLSKTRLARCFNNLSYHLARNGQFEEALQVVERGIALKEQGYLDFAALAASYGEKSEILMELGRFQEALFFDEKALQEVQRLADTGHTQSREEVWIYLVNRGRLYLRLGRVEEAEQLLLKALPNIHTRRRVYRMFAKDALEDIKQWRLKATSPHHQLDWRWVDRYRQLASFDSYWWLAPAGPFTEEEQQQWNQLYSHNLDEATKERLGALIAQSRERDLLTAIAEQHEPRLNYPAIAIEEVRSRIAGLLQLDTEIQQHEPNAIVRRLYHDTIEEEIDFLRLIEATYEGNSEKFWEYNLRLNPPPTPEEMHYALSRLRLIVLRGLQYSETMDVSQKIIKYLREKCQFALEQSSDEEGVLEGSKDITASSSQRQRIVSIQTAKRFFEAILQEYGYEGWQVVIDPNATSARVEQGLRQMFLADRPLSAEQIRHYISHELAGHIARCLAGEHSLLGLLGIHTKNSLETEEGMAVYYDRQTAILDGQAYDDTAIWSATLAAGLASGVISSPQTFLSLFSFFEAFYLLHQLLQRLNADVQKAQEAARRHALVMCLRIYRGVPNLERAGVCYTKDAHYLRGLRKIEQAVAQDETVLDRLAVGVVALDRLSDLQELGIVTTPQSLRKLANDPELDAYILSFEESENHSSKRE